MLEILIFLINLQIIYSSNYQQDELLHTPLMGWSSWAAFGCNPCLAYHYDKCLCQTGIETIANLLVDEGFRDVGYRYIILDDCWQDKIRDDAYRLQPNKNRFPNGMWPVVDYVHNKNLKLGIFTDLGMFSGQRFPGSKGFFKLDANTFANWGVDYIKVSAASAKKDNIESDYIEFGIYIKEANRKMIYATSWPAYLYFYEYTINYVALKNTCDTWRFYYDTGNDWSSILGVMDFYAEKQAQLRHIANDGKWNDADILAIGFDGITNDQAKAQIAVWCLIQSSLIFSTDIRKLTFEQKSILKNKEIIEIHQDISTKPGYKLFQHNCIDVWIRTISPSSDGYFSYAIAFVNRNESSGTVIYHIELRDLGLDYINGYEVTDVFAPENSSSRVQLMFPHTKLHAYIKPSGVAFFKAKININSNNNLNNNPLFLTFSNNEIVRYNY
ncbi:hypothetical protein PGB90_007061 [Kerria lacca]